MTATWKNCKNIICIRPDNMGDLLMSTPAIRALKQTFNCRITVLTSRAAQAIASQIPEIDESIIFDLPWVKNESRFDDTAFSNLLEKIRDFKFDAAVIFHVYSQNPLPSAMIAFMAGIPLRLAYCRENPYTLLTDWVPDTEPYEFVRHQVQRDLDLVAAVGANSENKDLSLRVDHDLWEALQNKLVKKGLDISRPWLIFHPGVSEEKRLLPEHQWIELAEMVIKEADHQIIVTGTQQEFARAEKISHASERIINFAGELSLPEFVLLISKAKLVLSVNTGTIHIAAATRTPVIVFYALTNPQHAPWHAVGKVFPFSIPEELRSRNEVIRFVHDRFEESPKSINLTDVIEAVKELLFRGYSEKYVIPELIAYSSFPDQLV